MLLLIILFDANKKFAVFPCRSYWLLFLLSSKDVGKPVFDKEGEITLDNCSPIILVFLAFLRNFSKAL